MGTSHFDSDVYGFAGTEVIRGFATISATALRGTTLTGATLHSTGAVKAGTSVTATTFVKATTYVQLGANQFILFGAYNTEATIVPTATNLTATQSLKGSLYLSTAGTMWIFDADGTATRFQLY
jgi:hypothetical protein